MAFLDSLLAWLSSLPSPLLLGAMGGLAAVENVFPPIPADVLVAFGGLLAARASHSPWPVFLVVWGGNVAGAALMYGLGRKYGSARVERKYRLAAGGGADVRILELHRKYGLAAFFISRFVPGVRSVVPPVAGALRIPFVGAIASIALASAIWYGVITWLAYRAGSNWEALEDRISQLGRGTAVAAGGVLLLAVAWWWLRRRRRAGERLPPA
jgi:membrane protein DedA with SNARE-associated domain